MSTESDAIDFWFDFISPYAYFASRKVNALASRHGRRVRWRPMLLGVSVMKTMGLRPLMETPLKADYVIRDVQRTARRDGVDIGRKLGRPPMNPLPAARALAWLDTHRRELAAPFAAIVFDRYWRLARELDQAEELRSALTDAGLDPADAELALARSPGAELLQASVAASLALGVFGSPFLVIDGEPFWGHDRLDEADQWLARGGW